LDSLARGRHTCRQVEVVPHRRVGYPAAMSALKHSHTSLPLQVGLAVLAGVAVGLLARRLGGPAGGKIVAVLTFVGNLFLRALKMVIVPLLAGSIVSGVAGIGSASTLGRLLRRTFTWYVVTSLAAILTGLLLVNLVHPGTTGGVPVGARLGLSADTGALQQKLGAHGAGDLVTVVLRMIPENPVAAATAGQMLPLITFCILLGAAVNLLPDRQREAQRSFWESLLGAMLVLTGWVIRFTPLGVLGLVGRIAATSGTAALGPLARYALVVAAGLALHAAVTLPLLLRVVGRVSPRRHFRVLAPALLTAFSTRSSSATLPLTMECVEHGAGVSNRVSSFVLPLGATVNMDGTALYECVAALFIAQAYGIHLALPQQAVVVVTALLASIGAAGIPSAGLVMISIILSTVGLPLEGVGLILAVDPLLDMLRTAVNVLSDSCGAVAVARLEGEHDLYPEATP